MKGDENKDGFEEAEDELDQEGNPSAGAGSDFADESDVGQDFDDAEDLKEEYTTEDQGDSSQLSRFKSSVSKDPKQSIMILLALVGTIGGLMYYFLYSGSSKLPNFSQDTILSKRKKERSSDVQAPVISGSTSFAPSYDVAIDPVKAKEKMDKMIAEKAKKMIAEKEKKNKAIAVKRYPVPPKIVSAPTKQVQQKVLPKPDFSKALTGSPEKPNIKTESVEKRKERASSRLKSSMLIGGSGGKDKSSAQNSSRDADFDYIAEASSAPLSKLTKVGQMSSIITQGKIIETVLETPVNTNYPGPIRALVSKDVYSEKGRNVLIAKGSRVIGEIAGGYQAGQTRLLIKWNRIILPSGYDIKVEDAPGVSNLGGVGIEGIVNRQLWNSLGNIALLSAINIGLAEIMEKEFKLGSNTTTSTVAADGTQTTNSTSSPTQQAAKQALQDTSSSIKQWVTDNFTSKPYIEVDQGTIVKIFVNSDIQFPKNISTGVDILK